MGRCGPSSEQSLNGEKDSSRISPSKKSKSRFGGVENRFRDKSNIQDPVFQLVDEVDHNWTKIGLFKIWRRDSETIGAYLDPRTDILD
jgi:hypothetical protein